MALSLEARTRNLVAQFPDYVRSFNQAPAFNDLQLQAHLDTLSLRARLGSASAAAGSEEFAESLRHTLEMWRMNVRGARLVAPLAFHAALRRCSDDLVLLEEKHLADQALDSTAVAATLWAVIDRMRITDTGARLVACTKALHHLLPELVVPMDRQFTGAFFGWNNQAWQKMEERSFRTAFAVFADIARRAGPAQYVGAGWNTNPTKVIDNAIVGFCRTNALDKASYEKAVIARAKELGIYEEAIGDTKGGDDG